MAPKFSGSMPRPDPTSPAELVREMYDKQQMMNDFNSFTDRNPRSLAFSANL
jgi:hypothetical protein